MITNCRISGEPIEVVIDLGTPYVSNFLPSVMPAAPKAPLRLGICRKSGLLQLLDTVDRESLYKKYWYRSGTTSTMRRQLLDVVEDLTHWVRLRDGDIVLDIGCNDGTQLSLYPSDVSLTKVGIDPAENLAPLAREHAQLHSTAFFTRDVFMGLTGGRKARVITTIAMFYSLADPNRFVADIAACLADDGIWMLQLSYTPLMILQNAFDNICHEHLEYYTVHSLQYLLERHGLKILDVAFNDTNSGSFRITVAKDSSPVSDVTLFYKDLGEYRYKATLSYERQLHFDDPSVYTSFMNRIAALRDETVQLLQDLKRAGKRVLGYGASTKGNTLLQYYGIDANLVEAIAERQPQKFNLFTVGSWIPIISEEEMRKRKPDYLLVLPWHFINEFLGRETDFRQGGGKFIVPLPQLQVF
jgi:hypothetical protein